MNQLADIQDAVHGELVDVAAGLRPAEAAKNIRFLPTGGILEIVILQAILPILTGIVSGIITVLATQSPGKKSEATKELELTKSKLVALTHRKLSPSDSQDLELMANAVSQVYRETTPFPQEGVDEIARQVSVQLERFHLGPETAKAKSTRIVVKVLTVMRTQP